jgi:hypothetical protein
MRAYRQADEEALLARGLIKDWAGEGFLTEAQQQQMEQETVCELRRTSGFLRCVLFFFSLVMVWAAFGLLTAVLFSPLSWEATGIFYLVFAVATYVAAEFLVSKSLLYRYGIEEAMLVCCVGYFLAGGAGVFLKRSILFSSGSEMAGAVLIAATALLSLWIWHRFGLAYFLLAGVVLVSILPFYWTLEALAARLTLAALFGAGLLALGAIRPRHRYTYLNQQYSIAEAILWVGIYLTVNLAVWRLWGSNPGAAEFWMSWGLTWCLPPLVLLRGIRMKDRFVMWVGVVTAICTLATNRLYFGWPQHSWDPMLLGALLIGLALGLRRWLAAGPGEIRYGFTARRLSGKDAAWIQNAVTVVGITSPYAAAPSGQAASGEVKFGGGDSGGGGASSDW